MLKLFSSGLRISGASGLPPGDAVGPEVTAGVDIGGGGGATDGGGGAETAGGEATGGAGGAGGVAAAGVGVGVGGALLSVMAGGPDSSDVVCNAGAPDKVGLLCDTLGAETRTGADCGCTAGVTVLLAGAEWVAATMVTPFVLAKQTLLYW